MRLRRLLYGRLRTGVCAPQQNRASVERHTSYFALSGRRGRVASRVHYGVVIRRPSPVEPGERVSSDRHDAARPIPGNQTNTYSPGNTPQQAPARHPRSPTGGSWRFPDLFRYARNRFHTYVSPRGLSRSRCPSSTLNKQRASFSSIESSHPEKAQASVFLTLSRASPRRRISP